MAFTRVNDPTLSQKDVTSTYQETFDRGVAGAHNLVSRNKWDNLALKSSNINPILEAIYKTNGSDLQEGQFEEIMGNIGLPPLKWVSGSSYTAGQRVYLTDPTDPEVYICIKNISYSSNVNNTQYWLKTPNYYTSNSLEYVFQSWIDNLKESEAPEWQADKTYYKNDLVSYTEGEIVYTGLCITTAINGTTADIKDSNNWLLLNLMGDFGNKPLGIYFKGEWDTNIGYSLKDMVIYKMNGTTQLYVANTTVPSNEPSPDKNSKWTMCFEVEESKIIIMTNPPDGFDYPYSGMFIYREGDIGTLYTPQLNLFDTKYLTDKGWTQNGDEFYGNADSINNVIFFQNTEVNTTEPPYQLSLKIKRVGTTVGEAGYLRVYFTDGTYKDVGKGANTGEYTNYSLIENTKTIKYIIGIKGDTGQTTYWKEIFFKAQEMLYPETNLSLVSFDSSNIPYSEATTLTQGLIDVYNHYKSYLSTT